MTNQELEIKIKEIINIENYFDMVIAIKNFEKAYKDSDFYKMTHQNLTDVIKNARIHYALQFDMIAHAIQTQIDKLDLKRLNALMDRFGEQLTQGFIDNQTAIDEIGSYIDSIK